mgnify:CR=1 FL=1
MNRENALFYLLRTRLKNQLKSMVASPGKLIGFLVMAALLVMVVLSGQLGTMPGQTYRPKEELTAMVFVLYAVVFFIAVNAGFRYGGSFFRMADVNLLFPSPLKPQQVLFYGLLRQMGTSLLVGLFLLFQYSWLHQLYGIGMAELIGILIGYGLNMFLGQTAAMVLYAATSGSERKRRAFQGLYYGVIAALAVYVLIAALSGESLLSGAVWGCNALPAKLFPLCGWMSMAVTGAMSGRFSQLLLGALLSLGGFLLLLLLLMRIQTDFYEDVLKSAETVQSAITAQKEGQVNEGVPRNVKVGKTGLNGGWGASVFFRKHMLENRRSRILLLAPTDLIFVVMTIIMSVVLWKDAGLIGVLLLGTYLQLFSAMLGRINRELTKPYIYLIPEPAMKKLVFALAEGLPTAVVEALLIYLPLGIILKFSPGLTACLIVTRIAYSVLFAAGNVAAVRLWGGISSQVVSRVLYLLTLAVLAVPGVIAVSVTLVGEGGITAALLILALVDLVTAAVVLFLCRNVLEWAELNHR